MGSRVLSLWLPYLATDRIRRNRCGADQADGPIATFVREKGALKLAALCPLAEQAGLVPAMPLADARAMLPGLKVCPSAHELDRKLLQELALCCERYTPWVAIDRSHPQTSGGALWLDIAGCAHLFDGEAGLLDDLLGRLRRQGLIVKAAIADRPGAAWAIARYGDDEQRILPINGARVALAPLPVAALRLADEHVAMLRRLGLERIEHLYPLPRQTLSARFGDQLVTRLDQALGLIDEPIAPHAPLPAQQAQLIFADPITDNASLLPLAERLLRQLCIGLEAAGLGARRLTLALYRVDNSTATLAVGTSRPCRDVSQLLRLFAEKVGHIDPGFGIERAILDAIEIEPLLPEAIAWRGLGVGDIEPMRDLAPLVDRLSARLGDGAVTRLQPRASHLPERAQRPVPAFSPLATALDLERAPAAQPRQETPPRPLRLLRRPEPIEAIAPLPDEPPILFRWRRGLHKIVRAQGPERIAPEWWRIPDHQRVTKRGSQDRLTRDYFAVEDADGGRFWLFREGLYGASPTALPRWYLHGLFA